MWSTSTPPNTKYGRIYVTCCRWQRYITVASCSLSGPQAGPDHNAATFVAVPVHRLATLRCFHGCSTSPRAASLATAQNAQKPLAGHGTQTLSCRADGGVASFTATLDSSSFAGNGYFNTKDVRIMDNCTSAAAPN